MLELVPPEDYKEEWKKWSMKTLPIIPESFKSRSYKDKGRKKESGRRSGGKSGGKKMPKKRDPIRKGA